MNFVSNTFLVFFAVVAGFYWILPHRLQNRLLLVASYVFYGWWDWRFLGLLLVSSLVDFTCGFCSNGENRPVFGAAFSASAWQRILVSWARSNTLISFRFPSSAVLLPWGLM